MTEAAARQLAQSPAAAVVACRSAVSPVAVSPVAVYPEAVSPVTVVAVTVALREAVSPEAAFRFAAILSAGTRRRAIVALWVVSTRVAANQALLTRFLAIVESQNSRGLQVTFLALLEWISGREKMEMVAAWPSHPHGLVLALAAAVPEILEARCRTATPNFQLPEPSGRAPVSGSIRTTPAKVAPNAPCTRKRVVIPRRLTRHRDFR